MFALIASGGGETVIDLGFTSTGGAGLRPQLLPRTGDQVDSWEVNFPVIQPCHQTHVYQLIHCCVSIIQPQGRSCLNLSSDFAKLVEVAELELQ